MLADTFLGCHTLQCQKTSCVRKIPHHARQHVTTTAHDLVAVDLSEGDIGGVQATSIRELTRTQRVDQLENTATITAKATSRRLPKAATQTHAHASMALGRDSDMPPRACTSPLPACRPPPRTNRTARPPGTE